MIITTPEQMREAAIAAVENERTKAQTMFSHLDHYDLYFDGLDDALIRIRAIPIAPQPVAVTIKPLVWEDDGHGKFRAQSMRGGEGVDRWTEPSVIGDDRVAYKAWGIDGVFDTPEKAQAAIEAEISAEILSDLTIHPSDPAQIRADALREALILPRYEPDFTDQLGARSDMKPDPHGDWISAADILAILATPLSPTAVDGSHAPDAGSKEDV